MYRWRQFRTWLGGVRHGATYKQALWLIAGQGSAMDGSYEAAWARDLAKSALDNHDPYSETPTPKLREAMRSHIRLVP